MKKQDTPSLPYAAIVAAPGFCLGLRCSEDEITSIEYLSPQPEVPPRSPLAQEAVRQLRLWLKNPRHDFTLPLAPVGSHFQRRVWQQIEAIPCGETRSYGDVAKAIGSAPRAVGGACGTNPYPVVVPCHRVVSATGLGGFAHQRGGFLIEVKRWLLDHERCQR